MAGWDDIPNAVEQGTKDHWSDIPDVSQAEAFKTMPGQEIKTETPWDRMRSSLIQGYRNIVRPAVEGLGMMTGAGVGGTSGTFGAGPVGTAVGGAVGAGLGAAGTSKAMDVFEETVGLKAPSTFKEAAKTSIYDFGSGVAGEALGPFYTRLVSKGASLAGKGASKVAQEFLGLTTGAGKGAVEGALRGGESFTKAMRGDISGEEISQNARNALEVIVKKRGDQYRNTLATIAKDKEILPESVMPVGNNLKNLISKDRFDIKMAQNPETGVFEFDLSKSPVIEQQTLVKKALEDVANWKDNTILGVDELKKRLGVYARQTAPRSPASTIIHSLESSVNNVLVKNVPNYGQMTRQYAEATRLIKDIESGLLLKKEGMSGRVTADNTLRRLSSALRENFEMRKDLLEALGNESGSDIFGQVSGYAMNQSLPHGLMGRLATAGTMTATLGALSSLNLQMLPVVLAASPRVVGEFLNIYGKALRASKPVTDVAGQMARKFANPASYLALKNQGGLE
jgi:hypothetical protein